LLTKTPAPTIGRVERPGTRLGLTPTSHGIPQSALSLRAVVLRLECVALSSTSVPTSQQL